MLLQPQPVDTNHNPLSTCYMSRSFESSAVSGDVAIPKNNNQIPRSLREGSHLYLVLLKVAVVSLGAEGCLVQNRDGAQGAAKAKHVRVVDTIGAGDNFTGAFLYAYLNGASLEVGVGGGNLL